MGTVASHDSKKPPHMFGCCEPTNYAPKKSEREAVPDSAFVQMGCVPQQGENKSTTHLPGINQSANGRAPPKVPKMFFGA